MQLLTRNAHIGNPEEYDFESCYTRLHPQNGIAEDDLVAAMLKHRGNYTRIANELGRTRNLVKNTVERDDEFRALRDDIRDAIVDEIEHKVLEQAELGDGTQARFVLQTIGKERGYVTREEKTGKDGAPLDSKIDASKLDDDTLTKLMEAKFGHNSQATE